MNNNEWFVRNYQHVKFEHPVQMRYETKDCQGFQRIHGVCPHEIGPITTRDACTSTSDDGGAVVPTDFYKRQDSRKHLQEKNLKLIADWIMNGIVIHMQYISQGEYFHVSSGEIFYNAIELAHERLYEEVYGIC